LLLALAWAACWPVGLLALEGKLERHSTKTAEKQRVTGKASAAAKGLRPSEQTLERSASQVELRAWRSIVLHHSATQQGDIASIDAAHKRRTDAGGKPWLGIGYHFVIGNGHGMADGEVQPTFRWRQQLAGAHAGNRTQNETGIGVCLIGDFNRNPPSDRQLTAAHRLVGQLMKANRLSPRDVRRHGDLRATDCPGRQFPWNKFIDTLNSNVQSAPSTPAVKAGGLPKLQRQQP